jgi:hypothetical protein
MTDLEKIWGQNQTQDLKLVFDFGTSALVVKYSGWWVV